jgi:iduronate 2-sulfatase
MALAELYDHQSDPEEWNNLISDQEYAEVIEAHKLLLPSVNKPWNVHSAYTFQPYFVEQKERTSQSK